MTLPDANAFIASDVTEAEFKTAFSELLDFLKDLVSSVSASQSEFANLKNLSDTTDYTKTASAEEYELNPLSDVKTDVELNLLSYIKNGVRYYAIPVQFDGGILLNGVSIDLNNLPNGDQKTFLNRALSSYSLLDVSNNEYELNPQAKYAIIDENLNIVFDVITYGKALKQIKTLQDSSDAYESRITTLENGSTVNQLIPFMQDNKIGIQDLTDSSFRYISVSHTPSSPRQLHMNGVMWDTDDTEAPIYFAEKPNYEAHPIAPRPVLVGWGHSFLDNARFMQKLQSLTGLPAYNYGKSGLQSTGIAGRHNSPSIAFNTSTGNIPASGSVTLTADYDRKLWYLVANSAGHVTNEQLRGSLGGVEGYVQWNGTNLTFTRTTAGEAVTLNGYTPFIVAPYTTQNSGYVAANTFYDLHDECINILWIGRNNIGETANILSHYKSIIEAIKTKAKKIVILAEFPASTDTAQISFMKSLNNQLAALYPEYFAVVDGKNALENFNAHLNPNFADDVADVAAGFTPRTLRYDSLHPSQTIASSLSPTNALHVGADVNAEFVYQFLQNQGWI